MLDYKLYNSLPINIDGLLKGLLGGLLIIVVGSAVIPSDGTPCVDRRVMCAPEPNHASDRPSSDEEPQSPSKNPGFVETRTATPITITVQDLMRMPK